MKRITSIIAAILLCFGVSSTIPTPTQAQTAPYPPQCIVNPGSYSVAAGVFWFPTCSSSGALNVNANGSTASPGFFRLQDGTTTATAYVSSNGVLAIAPCSIALTCQSFIGSGQDALTNTTTNATGTSECAAFNGTTWDRCRKDTYAAGPQWMTAGGSTTATVAAASAGPNVIKASAGRLARAVITTAGTTGTVIFYDNASACSGTIIGEIAGTTALAGNVAGSAPMQFDMPAVNGITECGGTGSAAVTLSYY